MRVQILHCNKTNIFAICESLENWPYMLMNSFNKTEAAVFSCRLCFLKGFPFHQFNITYYSWCLVPVWRLKKVAPYYIIVKSYFSGPHGSWSVHVRCLHLKMEFRSCARGRQRCSIIHYYWWTASIKPRLLFSRAGYAFWGLSLSSV